LELEEMQSFLHTLLVGVQMLSALIMIGLILVQHGKGADAGAAFGSGGSGSLFGASGSANFMSRTTKVFAFVFFVSTLALAYFSGVRPQGSGSVLEKAGISAPAVAASGAASAAAAIPGAAQSGAQAPAATTPASGASAAAPIPTK
jgi:preprotein translocase subunit SecG